MRTSHAVVEMVTAFVCTLVAGMSLLLPIDFAWSTESSALQLDMLAFSVPRAIAVGAMVAVLVAVFATTMNHAMAAWGSALFGIAIMFINHLAGHNANPVAPLSTLNFVDSIAGGILLGGIAAAVLRGRLQVFGWTLGALASVVIAAAMPVSYTQGRLDLTSHWPAVDSPPLWLIEITLVLVAFGTIANRRRAEIERRAIELPMAPILAGLLYIAVTLFGSEWLARHAADVVDITVAVAATVITAVIAAMLLPRRDGTLVLLAVALSSVGSAVIPAQVADWAAPLLVVAVAAGIVVGFRRAAPMVALAMLAGLALFGALTGNDGRLRAAVLAVVLAVAAGYCFGCAAPRYNPTRVLGVAIVLGASGVLAVRDHLSHGAFSTATLQGGQWSIVPVPMVHAAISYWMALAITIGCAAGLLFLRRWRAPTVVRAPQPMTDLPETSEDS
ncbi:hypothetical protein ABIA39_002908 [Nocardia sp. GAS34]|uniref:hypothetical protein n=1 Tax=unclassified Nocardia TaxID=2637762 RepID=UPI003D19FEAC